MDFLLWTVVSATWELINSSSPEDVAIMQRVSTQIEEKGFWARHTVLSATGYTPDTRDGNSV